MKWSKLLTALGLALLVTLVGALATGSTLTVLFAILIGYLEYRFGP